MKIYDVHYWDGGAWEDRLDCSERFYTTYEGAVGYLNDIGCIKDDSGIYSGCRYVMPEFVCHKGNIDCEDCELFCNSDKYNGTMFVDEGEETEWCPEHFERFESETDNSYWTIEECELFE